MPAKPLTLCTTYIPNDQQKLYPNIQLVSHLNKGARWNWVVVDNTSTLDGKRFIAPSDWFQVVEGPKPDAGIKKDFRGSYHHGSALNLARGPMRRTHSPYLLILDPDFYIVRPNWMAEVIDHMERHDLAFFGAPWHPRWTLKPRGFPCLHCLFIDTRKVPIREVDFLPEILERREEYFRAKDGKPKVEIPRNALDVSVLLGMQLGWLLSKASGLGSEHMDRMVEDFRMTRDYRWLVGTSRDTGYKLHSRYANDPLLKTELLQPVIRLDEGFDRARHVRAPLGRWYESLFPAQRSFFPKEGVGGSEHGFREAGLPDMTSQGWEEFMWQGQPFGFHVRGYFTDRRKGSQAVDPRPIGDRILDILRQCGIDTNLFRYPTPVREILTRDFGMNLPPQPPKPRKPILEVVQ